MKVRDLKKARQAKNAKIACENIRDILKVLDLSTRALEKFRGYKTVQNILSTMKFERTILDAHLKEFTKIKELK